MKETIRTTDRSKQDPKDSGRYIARYKMNTSMRNNDSCNGAPEGVNVFRSIQRVFIVPVLPLLMSGCATETDFLAQNSAAALRTAESRARFELNCPQVTSSILSQKVIEGLRLGYEWTEYTIGVRGCGKQQVYVTACRDQDNCNALSQTGRVEDVEDSGP